MGITVLDVTINYAVPVSTHVLGAHLDAYAYALPSILALRTCHRFGDNPNLSRLSRELLLLIEEYVIRDEWPSHRWEWRVKETCIDQRECPDLQCMMAHLDDPEIGSVVEKYKLRESCSHEDARLSDEDVLWSQGPAILQTLKYDDDVRQSHRVARSELSSRSFYRVPFGEHGTDLLLSVFGLQAWTAFVGYGKAQGHELITYLVLPDFVKHRMGEQSNNFGSSSSDWTSQTSATVPLDLGSFVPETEKSLRRFSRAMHILGLEVHENKDVSKHSMPAQTINSTLVTAAQSWPRLMVLSQATVGIGWTNEFELLTQLRSAS